MARNLTLFAVSFLASLACAVCAVAQSRPAETPPSAPPTQRLDPAARNGATTDAAKAPVPGDERKAVDDLLGRLAKTSDPQAARRIASAVQGLWRRSGSDTIDLLTTRAAEAQRDEKLDVATSLMDEVVSLKPDYAEGWNRRATLRFIAKNYDEAMADIRETLVREPRHFGAWVGLGRILAESGFDARALGAYRKALEIYPTIDGLKKQVEELTLKVEGQPI